MENDEKNTSKLQANGQVEDANSNIEDAKTTDTKTECEDEHSLDALSVQEDDSGITLSGKLGPCDDDGSCSVNSPPVVSIQDTTSDVDMCNDFVESLNDSAIPSSSSVSESSADVKFKASPGKDEKEDNMKDECSLLDSDAEDRFLSVNDSENMNSVSDKKKSDSPQLSRQEDRTGKSKHKNARTSENSDDKNAEAAAETNMENEVVVKEDSLSSLSSTEDDDDDDDDNENKDSENAGGRFLTRRLFRLKRRLRRRRNLNRLSSDDSSSSEVDDDDNDDDDDIDDGDNDELQNTDSTTDSEITDNDITKIASEILNKPTPMPNWYAVQEIQKREYGHTQRQSLSTFNEKVQSSIQMARRLQLVDSMKYHEGCVNSLCFNRIGTLLASGSDDLNIVLWNWQRGRPSLIYDSGHRSNVFQAKFMPYSGDCHVVSCARDGQVRLAELSLTGVCKNTRKLAQHRGAAHKLALEYESPNIFLSCGEDAVTFLFDLREERPHKLVTTKENNKKVPLYSIHSNPCDPRQFCVGGRDHYIRVYDKRKIGEDVDGGVMKKLCPDHLVDSNTKANVTCACYNYNGTEILGSYNDEDIYLFDNTHSDGSNYIHRYRGHRNNATVKGVNFYGPKSEFVVSGSDCGNLYIWEKKTESIVTFLEGDKAGVINVLEPHPSLPILATSGLDHEVKLWTPSQANPKLDTARLRKTIVKNQRERKVEAVSEPTVMSGQMLWMIMHHFRNTARRRLREEGQELSTSDDEEGNGSDNSESATEMNQCAQS